MKEINGFKISKTAYANWSKDEYEPSNEGLIDWTKDKLAASLSGKDIDRCKQAIIHMKDVANSSMNEKELVSIINSNKMVLTFYTKKGKIIKSFPEELDNQVRNLIILNESIKKLSKYISDTDINAPGIETLSTLNDTNLMPIFRKLSGLSFLGSIFISTVTKETLNSVKIKDKNLSNRVDVEKKIFALHWIKNFLVGTVMSITVPFRHYSILREAMKQHFLDASFSIVGILATGTADNINKELNKTQKIHKFNNSVKENLLEILEASKIDLGEFVTKSKNLIQSSSDLVETINKFIELDDKYKESDDSLIRDVLRNTRVLCSVGARVVNRQGLYYKSIFSEKE